MKRFPNCLACLFFLAWALLFLAACRTEKGVQAYLDEALRVFMERNEDTAAIIGILSEGLAVYPDNIALLEFRGNIYCSRGMLPECRTNARRLLALRPESIEPRMMLCMLDELEGADAERDEACYRDVVQRLAALPPAATPEKAQAWRLNYVFALLMARHPDAEREKKAFLEQTANDSMAWIYQGGLENFDRKAILRGIFTEESPLPLSP